LKTEIELLKEENARLRRGAQTKTRNDEVFSQAQDSKSPSLSNYSSNPRLATKVGKAIQKKIAPLNQKSSVKRSNSTQKKYASPMPLRQKSTIKEDMRA
jgi:hypothetical protein